ncbi:arylsulfatase A [Verrucomicrobiota bacterium]|nr:arylsulfatase A [Verrucomicrobiota bacterium]
MSRRLTFLGGLLVASLTAAAELRRPNIVVILADDLGYGDVGCYNPESKIPTPNLDRLAKSGVRFTDAHSPSTVCTPSRYSLLTGRMAFRTGYRGGVFTGVGGPSLIEADRLTLPGMLRQQGYATAAVGKWHVGLTFQTADGTPVHHVKIPGDDTGPAKELARIRLVDFTRPITDGPVHRGFDYFFGTACCPTTDWLYAYNRERPGADPADHPARCRQATEAPLRERLPPRLGRPGLRTRPGRPSPPRKEPGLADGAGEARARPTILLYHSDTGRAPAFLRGAKLPRASQAGPPGDFITELDFVVGELLATPRTDSRRRQYLDRLSSDNGPETTAVVHMRADQGHDPARPWRGMKRDDWEGGHRVPLIVRWHRPGGARRQRSDGLPHRLAGDLRRRHRD